MADEAPPPLPPDSAATGSVGPQSPGSSADASAIVQSFVPGTIGLRPITTAEQLLELAKSGVPAEMKSEILASIVVGAQQLIVADLQHRFDVCEKEGVKLRRKLSEAKEALGDARGDVRVRDERVRNLKSNRRRDTLLMFLSSVVFGIGGAFIGRSNAAAILGFAVGIVLFAFVLLERPADADGAK